MDHPEPSGVNRRGKAQGARRRRSRASAIQECAPPPTEIVIRQARPTDLLQLLWLERGFPGNRLSRRALSYQIANPRGLLLVAEAAGRPAGYALLLRRADSPWWRLYSLIRDPDAPRGTGRQLLEACLEAARAASAKGVRLEVREDNTTAIALYRSFGFTLFGTRDDYYHDGARALRMRLAFDP